MSERQSDSVPIFIAVVVMNIWGLVFADKLNRIIELMEAMR